MQPVSDGQDENQSLDLRPERLFEFQEDRKLALQHEAKRESRDEDERGGNKAIQQIQIVKLRSLANGVQDRGIADVGLDHGQHGKSTNNVDEQQSLLFGTIHRIFNAEPAEKNFVKALRALRTLR